MERLYILSWIMEDSTIFESTLENFLVQAENLEEAKSKFLDVLNESFRNEEEEEEEEELTPQPIDFEPYITFEEMASHEFEYWTISLFLNGECYTIDFEGDSSIYQKLFKENYPNTPL